MNGKRLVFLGFAAAVIVIVYRDFKQGSGAPVPAEFLGAATVYGIAGVIAEFAPTLGGTLAVGWTIGLLFNLINPGAPVATKAAPDQIDVQAKVRAEQGGNI